MKTVIWSLSSFESLSASELYALLQLRSDVFVIEQQCIYRDLDDKDKQCHHLLGYTQTGELAAYSRIVPPTVSYHEPSIGRVLTNPTYRGKNLGKELMQKSIEEIRKMFPNQAIRISAQLYLLNFYRSFGFVEVGESYDEDGIEHIEMVLDVSLSQKSV